MVETCDRRRGGPPCSREKFQKNRSLSPLFEALLAPYRTMDIDVTLA